MKMLKAIKDIKLLYKVLIAILKCTLSNLISILRLADFPQLAFFFFY